MGFRSSRRRGGEDDASPLVPLGARASRLSPQSHFGLPGRGRKGEDPPSGAVFPAALASILDRQETGERQALPKRPGRDLERNRGGQIALRYQHATLERDQAIADRLGSLLRQDNPPTEANEVAGLG